MPAFDTPNPISVTVEAQSQVADVHLIATRRDDTVVAVNPSDRSRKPDVEAAEGTRIELTSSGLIVEGPKPRVLGNYLGIGRTGSVQITIELPEGSMAQVKSGMGHIRADGRLGDVSIKTGAGDVQVDQTGELYATSGAGSVSVNRAAGHTRVTTAGDVRIGSVGGRAEVKSHNGKTWLGEVAGAVQVKSANGDIVIDRADGDVTAKTANGEIRLGQVATGHVVLATAAGALEIGVGKGTAAWIDAKTSYGRVHNHMEPAQGPSESERTVEITARTSFGDIVIHRSTTEPR
jgi:hypothetical protein